jgi:hypothetical protein
MNDISSHIVKINCKEEQGSGFIYFPENNPDYAYIFTARHCVLGETGNNGAIKTDIKIELFNAKGSSDNYQIVEEDILLIGADNDTEDLAIIIVKKQGVFKWNTSISELYLIKLTGREESCFTNGISKLTGNRHRRTLINCFLLPDKDYSGQIQVAVKDALVDKYYADDLIEGYSGSGIFIEVENTTYAFGIFLGYEEESKRVLGIDFSFANSLFEKSNFPALDLISVETNVNIINDLNKLNQNTQRVLNRIKTQVGTEHIKRERIINKSKTTIENYPIVMIGGKAGIGKSAVAKLAIKDLSSTYSIIVFRGEELDKKSIAEILDDLNIKTNITDLLDSCGLKPMKIILIESIEKLLETNNAETIIDFFSLLESRSDLKLVLTCRTYAIEQFKIRFLKNITTLSVVEVPPLDQELDDIGNKYPHIKNLLQKPALRKILTVPFNLDKAIIYKEVFGNKLSSEPDFKNIMWEYIIENKEKQPDANIRKNRALIFSEIAIQRAALMVPYVKISGADEQIIEALEHDNIIEVDSSLKNRYAPSHDIFEDWALTRYIEDKFNNWNDSGAKSEAFFTLISNQPAIKRSFRIWITEKIQNSDYALEEFIKVVLENIAIEQHWKDEILIAIMQSPYSENLLSKSKELLYQNNFFMFERCLLLLTTACQTPDFEVIKQFSATSNSIVYQNHHLKPFGEGWLNMINFIHEDIENLDLVFPKIIIVLLNWEKGLTNTKRIPDEGKKVGLIVLKYFELFKVAAKKDEYKNKYNKKLTECITLLFRLSAVLKEEIKAFLENALTLQKGKRNSTIENFNKKIHEQALSCLQSKDLCDNLPELVLRIAEKEWLYKPPSEKEFKRKSKQFGFISVPRSEEQEDIFGVWTSRRSDYMPASGYQTPIHHLLRKEPILTLKFISKLFNHSLKAFLKSNFLKEDGFAFPADERVKVTFKWKKKKITQYGSQTLWSMHRGGRVATPYLLQSVLMALENWLLELAEICEKGEVKNLDLHLLLLDKAIDELIENNKSVAVTAVVMSIAIAHPVLMIKRILPLLRVKEFYDWDFNRRHFERESLTFFGEQKYLIEERMKSYNRPHRKQTLEDLIRTLIVKGFSDDIFKLLDEFYAENSEDKNWRMALNRMDLRKSKVIEKTDTGFILQSEIDEDLKEIVATNQKEQDKINPFIHSSNWARKSFDGKNEESNTYENWKKCYDINFNTDKDIKGIKIWSYSGVLAALGIRDFFGNLSNREKIWCFNTVFKIIESEIQRSPYDVDIENKREYSAFEIEPCLSVLPQMIRLGNKRKMEEAKQAFFIALLFIQNELHKKCLSDSFRNQLWELDHSFALNCVNGLIEYSKISSARARINNFYPRNEKEEELHAQLTKKFEDDLNELFNSVFNKNKVADISIDLNTQSIWTLMDVISIIPRGTTELRLKSLVSNLLTAFIDLVEKESGFNVNDKIPYQLQQNFQTFYASYLINQDKKTALTSLKELIDWTFTPHVSKRKTLEFVENCLKEIISCVDQDHSLTSNFQLIWDYLLKTSIDNNSNNFNETLLLSKPYWNPQARDWKPMQNMKELFEKAIFHFNSVEPTIMLLSGIGYAELMPNGIVWFAKVLENNKSFRKEKEIIYFGEKLIQNVFYDPKIRNTTKQNKELTKSYSYILDRLIDLNSSVAFLIREDFLSLR